MHACKLFAWRVTVLNQQCLLLQLAGVLGNLAKTAKNIDTASAGINKALKPQLQALDKNLATLASNSAKGLQQRLEAFGPPQAIMDNLVRYEWVNQGLCFDRKPLCHHACRPGLIVYITTFAMDVVQTTSLPSCIQSL